MKIAAGEVVTSTGSVVKELIENALDSGATCIKLEIKNGGKDMIKVSDDGTGIAEDSIELAAQPHATSKIENWEDILELDTFGFRGEALSSIASVSELYIGSKTQTAHVGTLLFLRGGLLVERKKLPMNTGSFIEVRNLFFNVPARRKFLKSPSSESRYVLEVFEKFLLARPNLAFEFIRDSKRVYNCPGESLTNRISRVLKAGSPANLLDINYSQGDFSVHGAVSSPQVNRPNMTGITTFVNTRYVKDAVVYAAIRDFFSPLLSKGRYPLAVLFLTIPRSQVDVNVHPQKLEVKYSDGAAIYKLVKNALKSTFSDHAFDMRASFSQQTQDIPEKPRPATHFKESLNEPASKVYPGQRPAMSERANQSRPESSKALSELNEMFKTKGPSVGERVDKQSVFSADKLMSDNILGVVNRRYILIEEDDAMVFVDFHAAHERILFEQLKDKQKQIHVQRLLETISLDIDKASEEILNQKRTQMRALGFDYELEGAKAQIVGIPNLISINDVVEVFREIIDEFRLTELEKESDILDNVYATIACHNAFRTGDFVTPEQAQDLLRQMRTYKVFTCPHGRPVKFKLPFSQLDSHFKRS